MFLRRNILIRKILLAISMVFFVLFIFFRIKDDFIVIKIKVYPDRIINDNFYGFGVETLPWLWTQENRQA
ncbi:MAG: hypothetical protein NC826_01830, partial [Candidatus Omnitrophica bacterium]|nr:hypothetical protein [Candidatus Omnitrophota bacterium]